MDINLFNFETKKTVVFTIKKIFIPSYPNNKAIRIIYMSLASYKIPYKETFRRTALFC